MKKEVDYSVINSYEVVKMQKIFVDFLQNGNAELFFSYRQLWQDVVLYL